MRSGIRLLAAIASVAATLLFLAAGAVGLLLWTATGQELLEAQTERVLSTALGPDLVIEMEQQRVGFDRNAGLGLRFAGVILRDRVTGSVMATAENIGVGIGPGALFGDGLVISRLGVSGVRIAPAALSAQHAGVLPTPREIFASLDRSMRDLDRTGLRRLRIADLSVIGDPRYGVVTEMTMQKAEEGRFRLETRGTLNGQELAASGEVRLGEATGRVEELSLKTARYEFSTRARRPSADERGGPEFRIPTVMTIAMRADAEGRRLEATLDAEEGHFRDRNAELAPSASVTLVLHEDADELLLRDGAIDVGDVHAAFEGEIGLVPDGDGALPVRIGTTRLTSSIGSETGLLRSAVLDLDGRIAPESGRFDLERFALQVGRGELAGSGLLSGLAVSDRLQLALTAKDLAAPDVKAFWPFFLADGARNWVLEHMEGDGSVTQGSITLELTLERLAELMIPGNGPTDEEFELALELGDVAFRTLGELPAVEAASGRIEARGDTTVVEIDRAGLRGEADVAVLASSIEFGRGPEGTAALLSLNMAGDATALLRLADRKPIGALEHFDWRADEIGGRAEVGVGVAFQLARPERAPDFARVAADRPVDLESWSVVANLDGVILERKIAGRSISAITGIVSLAPGSALGDVAATVDGVPAVINFSQPLAPKRVGEASLTVTASLDAAEIRSILPGLGNVLDGPVSARLTRTGDRMVGSVDLGSARLSVPAIGWTKGPGVPATLDFDLVMDGERIVLPTAELKGEGFSATGSVEIDGGGLRRIELKHAAFNRGDSIAATVQRGNRGYAVTVSGASLDMRAVLDRLKSDWSGGNEDGRADPLTVSLQVDRLIGFEGEELVDAAVSYRSGGPAGATTSLTARTAGGSPVDLAIDPRENGRTIRLDAGDAGALLRFAGLYKRMEGGSLALRLTGDSNGRISGPLLLRDFELVDEPRLASLVGTTRSEQGSLAGALGRDLEVSRAYFDTASAGLSWDGSRLMAYDGILRGPIFGSSFEGVLYDPAKRIDVSGSFMPAYGVNRLFGALPFVGGILGNGAEGGLIGITYRLAGPIGDPTLAVNPISAIAPGIFRRIFEY
jgi:hypothetical protein